MFEVTPRLESLARTLADWASPATGTVIYVYGSRVRGDHQPDSDVDIFVDFVNPDRPDVEWWRQDNEEGFAPIAINLAGRLEILEHSDPLEYAIRSARPVYRDRNVVCVWLPPR